jgi:hypothetical protein
MRRRNTANDILKAGLLLLSLAFLLGMGQGPQASDGDMRAGGNATSSSRAIPSLEFLEFLATFNAGNDRFADPALLEALAPSPSRGTHHE